MLKPESSRLKASPPAHLLQNLRSSTCTSGYDGMDVAMQVECLEQMQEIPRTY